MKICVRYIFCALIVFISGCATHQPVNEATKKVDVWTTPHIQKELSVDEPAEEPAKEVRMTDDLWERVRSGFEIPDPDDELINHHVRLLQANPDYVDRVLQRSSSYLFYIIEEVEARDMPSELALLPFVESAFNPKAVSPAKAAGMWQFMPATGKDYNLKQNMLRDERGDIIKSTRAALDYLQRLYELFGDWQLALAAYNWGEGSVSRAIAKNQASNLNTDYFSLAMPNETRNYVPKLLAYKRIIDEPQKYGFNLPKVENHPYFVSVPIDRDIDVEKVVQLSEINREQFLNLNPSFNKPVILKEFNQSILLPYGKAEIFLRNVSEHPQPLASWTIVKVDKTDTVDHVASNLDTDPNKIREINNIPRGMKIRGGSTILIPRTSEYKGDVAQDLAQNPLLSLEREFVPVAVVMKCRGKKCVAVPSNLANYNPKNPTTTAKQSIVSARNKGTTAKVLRGKEIASKTVNRAKSAPSKVSLNNAAKPMNTKAVKTIAPNKTNQKKAVVK